MVELDRKANKIVWLMTDLDKLVHSRKVSPRLPITYELAILFVTMRLCLVDEVGLSVALRSRGVTRNVHRPLDLYNEIPTILLQH